MVLRRNNKINRSQMRKIINQVAKKHGVTAAEVKRDMQHVINSAFVNPTKTAQAIPKKGNIPTPDEFITYFQRKP